MGWSVEAQPEILRDAAYLGAVIEGHHDQAEEDHGRDRADPVVVQGRQTVLRTVGGHPDQFDGAQVGGDERQAGHPRGQRPAGEEEVEAGRHRPPGDETDSQHEDEIDDQDRVVHRSRVQAEVIHAASSPAEQ